MRGRMRRREAPVVPIQEAIEVPKRRMAAFCQGVPERGIASVMRTPPAVMKSEVMMAIKGMYSWMMEERTSVNTADVSSKVNIGRRSATACAAAIAP